VAINVSSENSRPRTVRVAWRIEARMIPPESTTVPSRSKSTTGNRTPARLRERRLAGLATRALARVGPHLHDLDLAVGPEADVPDVGTAAPDVLQIVLVDRRENAVVPVPLHGPGSSPWSYGGISPYARS